jgi:hypothetical protein
MYTLLRLSLILTLPILLSSCMKLDAHIMISASGTVMQDSTIDMSGIAKMMESFSGLTDSGSSSSDTIDKDLCKDGDFQEGLTTGGAQSKLENMKCTSLGDYKARITGTQILAALPGAYQKNGVTIVDVLALGEKKPDTSSQSDSGYKDAEAMGFEVKESITLPGTIVYHEAGALSGTSAVHLNLLDPKVIKRNSLYIVSTPDGKKLTPKELNRYKLLLKQKIRKERSQITGKMSQ